MNKKQKKLQLLVDLKLTMDSECISRNMLDGLGSKLQTINFDGPVKNRRKPIFVIFRQARRKVGIQEDGTGSRLSPGRLLDPGFHPRIKTLRGRLGDDFLRSRQLLPYIEYSETFE